MNNPNCINAYLSTLLNVDYAIEYATYKQFNVSC